MTPPRLLLDMDGPLADFDKRFFEVCSSRGWSFDVECCHKQRHRYFTDHMPDPIERAWARELVDGPGWFADLPVVEGAVEGVKKLIDRDVDIWVCTKPLATSPTCAAEKLWWIEEHFPDLADRVVIVPDKSLVRGSVLLDDAPKLPWLTRAVWRPVIFSAPYNGAGSKWEHLPRWHWSQEVDTLIDFMR